MTASSLDLFSRQVPLIGLPPQAQQTTTTATVNGVTNVNGVLRQRVSRNLFGGPKTGEINQMLKQETQRQKAYVLKRYLVNLENLDANERIPSEMPSLIAKELQEYEQRITKEKCNLNRDLVTSTTSPAENSSSAKLKQITQIKRTASNNNTEDAVLCGSERGKPYARQTLMTDCFNKRKMTPTLTPTTTAAVTTTTAVTATAAITVNACNAGTTTASSNDLQVLDLPNPMRATLSLCTSSAESALISAATTTATEVDNTTTCDVAAITTTVDTNLATTPHL